MTKLTILWLIIISLLAAVALFLLNGAAFNACYDFHISNLFLGFANVSPEMSCLISVTIVIFLILFLGPLLLTLLFYGIYVLIFNRPMEFSRTILWITWLIFLYYCIFLLNFYPIV